MHHRSAFDRMMTVVVGTKEFQMYRGLLCFHSEYFKKLLDGPFKEGGSNKHRLADVTPDTFTMFYNWIHTSTVTDLREQSDAELEYDDLVNLHAFADFHMVQQLKNRSLELYFMCLASKWVAPLWCTSFMYEETTEKSRLRALHVDILAETSAFDNWRTDAKQFPKDFIADIFDIFRKQKTVPGSAFALRNGGTADWINSKRDSFCEKYHNITSLSNAQRYMSRVFPTLHYNTDLYQQFQLQTQSR
ncbi:hypothetical protein CC86DRAFT_361136 [Ophiobolus disseminans]|uniref:BTB domain-containing protein n=1 Tax=Ophiobolus disseminans TaxID=1469910 RepID=A0A6A6ZHH1_9PLEO|nr:hypothetical protein CC86DRAFT_361136 [Ophiobolus disseminans]